MTVAVPPPRGPERSGLVALVDRVASVLDRRTSRRGLLSRVAVVGSALAVSPWSYALRPGTAYASVCGPSATCSSGYTVFCATIRNGVNRCPPNSLVGGWWKADGSGFCGGQARYYIDCHSYCSCGCTMSRGGWGFCSRACTACGPETCGPAGQCDQRKVCTNNFRYGQCMRHVSCSGPVWCRVVTCTPPWRVSQWQCTSTTLTDNNTLHHSSPQLPGWTPIVQRYTAMGGQGSVLGEPATGELPTPDGVGRYTHYDAGSIYWTPSTGAHAVWGEIRRRWESLGWETGPLGYPVTSETPTPDGLGRFNHFSKGGSIYWTPSTGAQAVWGPIRSRWQTLGWEAGPLGYPLLSDRSTGDGAGRFNHFSKGGSIFWTESTGAHAVWGAIRKRWEALGWETGPLGYPVTSETPTPDGVGRFNHFSKGGSIYWTPSTGAQAVWGPIRSRWQTLGWEAG
ncbi:MAG: LGFP repeat-containing protein, partial [Actinomycetes bacterium]